MTTMLARIARCGVALTLLGTVAFVVSCGGTSSSSAHKDEQEVTVTARDIAFAQPTLSLAAGRPVHLTLVNEGAVEHDLTVVDLSADGATVNGHGQDSGHTMGAMAPGTVHVSARGKERAVVEFTAKTGTYEYYCSVPGHREAGMRGTLTVK